MTREVLAAIYRPHGEGSKFLLFDGELEVQHEEKPELCPGQVELRLYPKSELLVHVFGSQPAWNLLRAFGSSEEQPQVSIPAGVSLAPPPVENASKQESPPRSELHAGVITAGDLDLASHLLFHVSGGLEALVPNVAVADGEPQRQLDFKLPGWDLVLAPGEQSYECRDFAAVVKATPASLPIQVDDVTHLDRWLFVLLSFLANREIGVGPVCGLNEQNEVVWTELAAPRLRAGKAAINWCPPQLVASALPELADGLGALGEKSAMEVIVDRAIGYSLAANGDEVIDVKIPNACSGLELLAWSVLQSQNWLIDGDTRRRLKAAGILRLLLKWAGIPTALPDSAESLEARKKRTGEPWWQGPEILFNIRNRLVHPPKKLSDPEWPDGEEMFEAWQLGTWYLELVLLRILGYRGEYWSRMRLGRSAVDTEPVPWTMEQDLTA